MSLLVLKVFVSVNCLWCQPGQMWLKHPCDKLCVFMIRLIVHFKAIPNWPDVLLTSAWVYIIVILAILHQLLKINMDHVEYTCTLSLIQLFVHLHSDNKVILHSYYPSIWPSCPSENCVPISHHGIQALLSELSASLNYTVRLTSINSNIINAFVNLWQHGTHRAATN